MCAVSYLFDSIHRAHEQRERRTATPWWRGRSGVAKWMQRDYSEDATATANDEEGGESGRDENNRRRLGDCRGDVEPRRVGAKVVRVEIGIALKRTTIRNAEVQSCRTIWDIEKLLHVA